MAGRRKRRASTSTVATVDDSHIRWAKESTVLKPLKQGIPDDDWPCYVLTDATVYRKDGKTIANPLLVQYLGPLVVRGFLEVDEDNLLPTLVKPSQRSAHIEISLSQKYSFGDGPVTLWVSGVAGWFEIRPSAKYQKMFNQVLEAISLYYGVFDVYEAYTDACGAKKKSKRPSPPTLDQIFLKYAIKVGDGIVRDEVEALCHKWSNFFIAHFPKEPALEWDGTLFAEWLRDSHPDVQKIVTDMAKGIMPPPPLPEPQEPEEDELPRKRRAKSTNTSSRGSEVRDVEMRDFAPGKPRSPPRKPVAKGKAKTSETPIPLPERFRQPSQPTIPKASPTLVETPIDTPMSDGGSSDSPVDRLLDVLQEIAGDTDVKKSAPSKVNSGLFFKCKMRHYTATKEIVAYYAKELLPRLGPEWHGTPWYESVKAAAKQTWQPSELVKVEDIPAMTFRRTKMAPKPSSSKQAATKLPPSLGLGTKTRKSVQNLTEDESDEESVALQRRSRKSGKGASLRLITTSKKRPASDLDDQTSGSRRGRKSAKSIHQYSDDEQLEDAEESNDDEVDNDENPTAPLPEGTVRIVVHAERLPTASPAGPNGTWTCDQEGCSYVVRSADEQDAQEMIQAHFRDHEAEAEKINLAVKESRGHMPINHLLDKIQALGKAALLKSRKTLNGDPVPMPVKRRMPI